MEKLLAEAVRASSDGDFETAWTSHRRAWQIAVASREAGDAMQGFCERHDCPRIRKTAWLLGKPSSELGFLARDCRGRESESDACGRWFDGLHRVRAHLGPDRRAPGHPPHELGMRFIHLKSGDLRPWTVAAVGGKTVWAILDTGAPLTVMGRDWANLQGLHYAVVGDPYTQRMWDGVELRQRLVVLRDVELGSVTEERMLAAAPDGASWSFLALGMDVLLRHGSACFAWSDSTLHLGRMGPCEGGLTPFGARLDPTSMKLVMLVPATEGTSISVVVDTAARDNHCKRSLAERLRGRALAFGDHPALQAACGPDGKWPPKHEDNPHAMTIGMETLSKFEAFGWELDPFRMYFVPRRPGSVVKGFDAGAEPRRKQEVVEERLTEAVRAVGEGDFPTAWNSLRLAYWTALSSQEAADAKTAFCARRECPDIWRIAWLAGRPSSDLGFFGGICKDIEVEACSRWLALQHLGRNYLGPVRRLVSNPSQDVPMRFIGGTGDRRLRAIVEVGGKPTPALLNTGAQHSGFRRKWANIEAVDYDVVGDPYIETRPDGAERRARLVVLRNLTVGRVSEQRVLAIARDDRHAEFELGIDVLLRYGPVCFALAGRRLHLGEPGPCASGHSPLRSRLDVTSARPIILVPRGDGTTISVLVDTGAHKNRCTHSLAKHLQGRPLSLAGHEALQAACGADTDRRSTTANRTTWSSAWKRCRDSRRSDGNSIRSGCTSSPPLAHRSDLATDLFRGSLAKRGDLRPTSGRHFDGIRNLTRATTFPDVQEDLGRAS